VCQLLRKERIKSSYLQLVSSLCFRCFSCWRPLFTADNDAAVRYMGTPDPL